MKPVLVPAPTPATPADARLAAQARAAVAATADAVELDADAVGAAIASRLHREVAELPQDPGSWRFTERAATKLVLAFTRAVRSGASVEASEPTGEALAMARTLARNGHSVRPLLRICHVGHHGFLAAWEDALRARQLPEAEHAAAARQSQDLTFTWIDAIAQQLSDEHERESERVSHAAETRRLRLVRAILAGEVDDQHAVSRALGYELARHHTALVLWTDGAPRHVDPAPSVSIPGWQEDDAWPTGAAALASAAPLDTAQLLERAAADVAKALGGGRPLLLAVTPTSAHVWVGTVGAPDVRALERLAANPRTDGVSLAVGEPARDAVGFAASHREAEDAHRVALLSAAAPGTVTRFQSVELITMLSRDLDRAARFVRSRLGDLAADDAEHDRLRETLRIHLAEEGDRQATARRLGVHHNTVSNRVRAARRLLADGPDPDEAELHVALLLANALGAHVLAPVIS